MEKLILRGVMWGADKIPDSVFDKIPGGYYKAKEVQYKKEKAADKAESRTHRDDMPQRRSRRRYSEDDYDDRKHRAGDRNDGYTSDGHSRRSDVQRHDGGGDDYDTVNDRPRRRRSRADLSRGCERSQREDRNAEGSLNAGWSYHDGPVDPPPMSPQQAASGAAYGSPPATQAVPNNTAAYVETATRSTSTLRGGMATGYVPYANIYGGPAQTQQYPGYAPPPSDTGSVQPNYMNQVAPPVQPQQGYHQNPFAQSVPPNGQPGYVADPYYNARRYDDRYDERSQGIGGTGAERRLSRSPPRRHRSQRDDYSPSHESYDTRGSRRRARSERRHDDQPPSQVRERTQMLALSGRSKHGVGEEATSRTNSLAVASCGAEFPPALYLRPSWPTTTLRLNDNDDTHFSSRKAAWSEVFCRGISFRARQRIDFALQLPFRPSTFPVCCSSTAEAYSHSEWKHARSSCSSSRSAM